METISFARGIPAPELLPVVELADCARAAIERDGRTILNYGAAGGYAPLRGWIADRHGVAADRVVLTNGSLQGLAFLAGELVPKGRVLVETPTYDRPLKLLADLGADVHGIPLVDIAREHNLLVVEDDPYGLVRFEGDAPPTLFELAGGDGVVYGSSFSKTIAPGARVGYLVLPDGLAQAVTASATATYITPSLVGEAAVYEFVRRGLLETNLARVRDGLRARRDAMLEALERQFGAGARWSRPEGGYFLWLELSGESDARELLGRAEAAGVTFVPGVDFGGPPNSLRLAFSFVDADAVAEGISRLASVVPTAAAVELAQ